MFWWKGNGLWLGMLVALIVASASKAMGPMGVPLGLVSAAVIVFVMRSVFEESSLYSVPYKAWPPLLLVLAVLTYLSG